MRKSLADGDIVPAYADGTKPMGPNVCRVPLVGPRTGQRDLFLTWCYMCPERTTSDSVLASITSTGRYAAS